MDNLDLTRLSEKGSQTLTCVFAPFQSPCRSTHQGQLSHICPQLDTPQVQVNGQPSSPARSLGTLYTTLASSTAEVDVYWDAATDDTHLTGRPPQAQPAKISRASLARAHNGRC
jgi:hypothetical protein